MNELKPCPFCGGTDIRIKRDLTCGFETFSVQCMVCDAPQNYHDSERGAIDAWNTRAERTCKQKRLFNLVSRECDGEYSEWHGEEKPNYCPNCGAKVVDE